MNRRRVIGLALFGVAIYVVTLVLTLPANRVLAWVEPEGVHVRGAAGRIWAGSAEHVRLDTVPLALADFSWDVTAWRLLTGELGADVTATVAGIEGQGYVGATVGRNFRIADAILRGPVSELVAQSPYPLAASGSLLARIEEGAVVDSVPRGVRGRAVWSDARLQAPMALDLGEVIVDIEPDQEGQRLDIEASGGEVDMAGELVLHADGKYDLQLALTPTEQAASHVRDTLTLVARPDQEGRYLIRRTGQLR